MSNVWRSTGPPENWITAFGINKWALNENSKGLWATQIQPGDTVIFHSTRESEFTKKGKSVVIGFGYVGRPLSNKHEFWWLQEIREKSNKWPYVIPLKEVYLFSETKKIDFATPIQEKSDVQILEEIEILTRHGIEISVLNKQAKAIASNTPNFPVNGSASRINIAYENLILNVNMDLFSKTEMEENNVLEIKLGEKIDDNFSRLSKAEVLKQAMEFDNSQSPTHKLKSGDIKIRIEDQKQKRRVAKLEDYTCQVCSFKFEYTKSNGKPGWIINVDHIIEKAGGGNENLDNLWVLCPNCHTKKTYGIIVVDMAKKKVYENGIPIMIRDQHLFNLR